MKERLPGTLFYTQAKEIGMIINEQGRAGIEYSVYYAGDPRSFRPAGLYTIPRWYLDYYEVIQ